MAFPAKIATCCYCGSKATLTVGKGRHELSCANCGAPLRDLKMLPKRQTDVDRPARTGISHQPRIRQFPDHPKKMPKPRKKEKRKRWVRDFAEDIFDLVEDIFD